MENEVVSQDLTTMPAGQPPAAMPFSILKALPVFTITLTEGFEASLVLAAAGAFNLEWTVIGGLVSVSLLIVASALSYRYLLRVPRWLLDLIAGVVLLSFGLFFLASGVLSGVREGLRPSGTCLSCRCRLAARRRWPSARGGLV